MDEPEKPGDDWPGLLAGCLAYPLALVLVVATCILLAIAAAHVGVAPDWVYGALGGLIVGWRACALLAGRERDKD